MTTQRVRCDVTGLVTTETVIGVDWASGPDITVWVEATPRGIRQHYAQDGRPTGADYRANAKRWCARDWDVLTRRERRRLLKRPALLAMHKAWNWDRDMRQVALTRMMLAGKWEDVCLDDLLNAAPIRSIARRTEAMHTRAR